MDQFTGFFLQIASLFLKRNSVQPIYSYNLGNYTLYLFINKKLLRYHLFSLNIFSLIGSRALQLCFYDVFCKGSTWIYIYYMIVREIWRFNRHEISWTFIANPQKKSYFHRALLSGIMIFPGEMYPPNIIQLMYKVKSWKFKHGSMLSLRLFFPSKFWMNPLYQSTFAMLKLNSNTRCILISWDNPL